MSPMQVVMESMGQSIQVAQALRAAAQQQKQLDEQKRQFDLESQLRQEEMGLRKDQFKNQQGQQQFTNLMDALNAGGEAVSDRGTVSRNAGVPRYRADEGGAMVPAGAGTNEPVDMGRTVAAGAQRFYIPTRGENAREELRVKTDQAAALQDLNSFSLPDELSKTLYGRPGVRLTGPQAQGLADALRAAAPPKDTPDQIISGYNVSATGRSKYGKLVPMQLPPGVTRELTPGQAEVAARFKERQADRAEAKDAATINRELAAQDKAQKQIDVYQSQEQAQHALRTVYGNASALNDGELFYDPATKKEVEMNKARRRAYKAKYDAATQQVERLQTAQKKLIARHGGDERAPAQTPQAASATGGRGSTGAQPSGYTEAEVRQRAAAAGRDPEAAVKLARQQGLIR